MYMENDEKPTPMMRWNTFGARTEPRLQQQWSCRKGRDTWMEWRDLPIVHQAPSEREPTYQETMG